MSLFALLLPMICMPADAVGQISSSVHPGVDAYGHVETAGQFALSTLHHSNFYHGSSTRGTTCANAARDYIANDSDWCNAHFW